MCICMFICTYMHRTGGHREKITPRVKKKHGPAVNMVPPSKPKEVKKIDRKI